MGGESLMARRRGIGARQRDSVTVTPSMTRGHRRPRGTHQNRDEGSRTRAATPPSDLPYLLIVSREDYKIRAYE